MSSDEFKIPSSQILVNEKTKIQKPKLFKVILLNDDYTPMEYVVKLLKVVFNKSESDAVNIMLMVHKKAREFVVFLQKKLLKLKF